MATVAKALGKKLSWNAADIAGLRSLEVDHGEREVIDAAHLGTLVTAAKPVLFGLRSGAKITFRAHFDKDDTVHAAMLADYKTGTSRACVYTRTDATPSTATWADAVITSFQEPDGTPGATAQFGGTITCNGDPTEA